MAKSRTSAGADPESRRSRASEVAAGIFVGGQHDAVGFSGARFCVRDERPEPMSADLHVPIYDGRRDAPDLAGLDRVTAAMRQAHDEGRPVLVFCGHGVRRAPLAAAWYLHRFEALPLRTAFDRIQKVRPEIERPEEWIGHCEDLEG